MMATNKVGGGVAPTKKLIKSALIGAGLQTIDSNILSKCMYYIVFYRIMYYVLYCIVVWVTFSMLIKYYTAFVDFGLLCFLLSPYRTVCFLNLCSILFYPFLFSYYAMLYIMLYHDIYHIIFN